MATSILDGPAVRAYLKRRNETQRELARRAGLPAETVCRALNGQAPSLEVLTRIYLAVQEPEPNR